jgi:hypothetical protein
MAIAEGQFSDVDYNIKVNKKSGNNGSFDWYYHP